VTPGKPYVSVPVGRQILRRVRSVRPEAPLRSPREEPMHIAEKDPSVNARHAWFGKRCTTQASRQERTTQSLQIPLSIDRLPAPQATVIRTCISSALCRNAPHAFLTIGLPPMIIEMPRRPRATRPDGSCEERIPPTIPRRPAIPVSRAWWCRCCHSSSICTTLFRRAAKPARRSVRSRRRSRDMFV